MDQTPLDRIHKAFQEAAEAYNDVQTELARLNDFDSVLASFEAHLGLPSKEGTPSQRIAADLLKVCRYFMFLQRVAEIKIKYVVNGLQWAIADKNPIVEFALLRSLIEHLAALCFQADKIYTLEQKLKGNNNEQKINEALASCVQALERLFYGQSADPHARYKRFHTNDFLESLEQRVGEIHDVYNYLCDFVHPNYGSNLLVSSGNLGSGVLDPPADTHADHLIRACSYAIKALNEVGDVARTAGATLARVSDYITIATMPNQSAGSIFSRKALRFEGTGKSKQDAIFFRNARTSAEAVGMIYRYLEEQGLRVTGVKAHGGIEGGFIFDVFPTNRGSIWFKTKMTEV
jgi:hypothetical protein